MPRQPALIVAQRPHLQARQTEQSNGKDEHGNQHFDEAYAALLVEVMHLSSFR